jgi:nicotinic acid mononucleotide adenylyltransferase
MRTGAYPGSFDPPTVAHLAVADAARRQGGLDRIDLVVSEVALGKEDHRGPAPAERLAVLEALARSRPWLGARLTPARLLVDIAAGYDALILGADKWAQLIDPAWYDGSEAARDAVLQQVPPVLVAPRPPFELPLADPPRVLLLDVDPVHAPVSSTAVRDGRVDWMLEEAAAAGLWLPPQRDPGR